MIERPLFFFRKCLPLSLIDYILFRFATKESATHAIVAVHNTDIIGQVVKCSWGKESGDPNNAPVAGQVITRTSDDINAVKARTFSDFRTFSINNISALDLGHTYLEVYKLSIFFTRNCKQQNFFRYNSIKMYRE